MIVGSPRFGAVDVQYGPNATARAAIAVYADRAFGELVSDRVAEVTDVADYEPGAFFRRELPAVGLEPALDCGGIKTPVRGRYQLEATIPPAS